MNLLKFIASLLVMVEIGNQSFSATSDFSSDLQQTKNVVEFLAVGKPSAIKIRGELKEKGGVKPVKGNLLISQTVLSGRVEVQLAFFDTGIELRNDHMLNKYLEVKKFPTAELANLKAQLPPQAEGDTFAADNISFTAELTLHGVKKPINGLVEIKKRKGSAPQVELKFDIDTKSFAIETPAYLGIRVTDSVHVTARVEGVTK